MVANPIRGEVNRENGSPTDCYTPPLLLVKII